MMLHFVSCLTTFYLTEFSKLFTENDGHPLIAKEDLFGLPWMRPMEIFIPGLSLPGPGKASSTGNHTRIPSTTFSLVDTGM
jgi:hypothetical protein